MSPSVTPASSTVAESELDHILHNTSRQDNAKIARALHDTALMTSQQHQANTQLADDDVFVMEIEKTERGLGLGLIDGLVSRCVTERGLGLGLIDGLVSRCNHFGSTVCSRSCL